MIDTYRSKLSDQDITDLSGLFDMFAMYDFEDTQKVSGLSQEIDKDFSSVKGKSLPASCDQDKTNELENPSFKGTEVKRLL